MKCWCILNKPWFSESNKQQSTNGDISEPLSVSNTVTNGVSKGNRHHVGNNTAVEEMGPKGFLRGQAVDKIPQFIEYVTHPGMDNPLPEMNLSNVGGVTS